MFAPIEFRSLPLVEPLRLVDAIWESIVEDQNSLPDDPAVIQEVRERKARYLADPSSGIPWAAARGRIESSRG
jgi:putative addiction module component (TIGR02574 family)